jgi:hypothetical protein
MEMLVESILFKWQSATLTDYAHVLLAIVVVGWFISRYQK